MKLSYSVLICTFNGEKYIEQQIKSILDQSIKAEMFFVSDDGSTDSTIQKVKNVFDKYNVNNYRFLKGPKRGASHNFLSAIHFNQSDFLFISDQDDIWQSNKITEFNKYLLNSDMPMVWYSDSSLIDEFGTKFEDSFFQYQGLSSKVFLDDSILYKNCIQGATSCINLSMCNLVRMSLKYVNVDKILMHDWWIALLAKYFGSTVFIDQPLIQYRQHNSNEIGASSKLVNTMRIFTNPKAYLKAFKSIQCQHVNFEHFCLNYNTIKHLEIYSCKFKQKENYALKFKYCGFLKSTFIYLLSWRVKLLK